VCLLVALRAAKKKKRSRRKKKKARKVDSPLEDRGKGLGKISVNL